MKTYLFDFDGTLVDSMPTFIHAALRILDENDIAYGEDIIKIITPLGFAGTANYYIRMGINKTQEEIVAQMKEYMKEGYFYHIEAKKNVISVLHQLKEQGASLNVLTASPHITLDACLRRLGMYELFEHVWSCDDFGMTKAEPGIYKKVAEILQKNEEEILFLDDNLNADRAAREAGMVVCGVYDESSKDYVEEMKQEMDYYIYDLSELLSLEFPSYTIVQKPDILDWSKIPFVRMDIPLRPGKVDVSATGQLCYTDEALYVRLAAKEKHIRAEHNGLLDEVCEDSCLEFFFCPIDGDSRYFNIEYNPNCCIYLGVGSGIRDLVRLIPESGFPFLPKVIRTEDGWEITYQIPFEFIRRFFPGFSPTSGKRMRGNFYKCGGLTVQKHHLCWSRITCTPLTFHSPGDFGYLTFE